MSSLIRLEGFFINIGGDDYPRKLSPEDNFGFNRNQSGDLTSTPVFKYNYLDILDAFKDPYRIVKNSLISEDKTNELILERQFQRDWMNSQGLNRQEWNEVAYITEILHNNAISLNEPHSHMYDPNQPEMGGFRNKGDALLSLDPESISEFPGFDTEMFNSYVERSLVFRINNGRLEYVQFAFNFDALTADNNREIYFTIYFHADRWVERVTNVVETAGVHRIPTEEMQGGSAQIQRSILDNSVSTIREKVYKGRYKNVITASVNRINTPDLDPDDPAYATEVRYFYIFLKTDESFVVSTAQQHNILRNYLIVEYGSENIARRHYPELFPDSKVYLYPIYENIKRITGEDTILNIHALSLNALYQKMQTIGSGFNPTQPGYYPTEIFYVNGGESHDYQSRKYTYPILAIDAMLRTRDFRPISDRFPYYKPVYNVEYEPTNDDWQRFHHYLIVLMELVELFDTAPDHETGYNMVRTRITNTAGDLGSEVSFDLYRRSTDPIDTYSGIYFNYLGVSYVMDFKG